LKHQKDTIQCCECSNSNV